MSIGCDAPARWESDVDLPRGQSALTVPKLRDDAKILPEKISVDEFFEGMWWGMEVLYWTIGYGGGIYSHPKVLCSPTGGGRETLEHGHGVTPRFFE